MANLMDLPNELLCQVLEYPQLTRSVLWELARMNRRLHDLTQPFLFRHANDLSGYQLFLLSRTLRETPGLKKAIWAYGPIDTEENGYVSLFDFHEVIGLINLKKLQISIKIYLPRANKSLQSLFRTDSLGQVEEMELTAYQTPKIKLSGVLHELLSELPSVHTLTVMDIPKQLSSADLGLRADLCSSLPLHGLRTLKLRRIENTSLDSGRSTRGLSGLQLRDILRPFTNLNSLHCTDMFFHISRTALQPRLKNQRTTVRFANLGIALREVKDHLQELVLTMTSDEKTILDGRPLDLSTFTSLNKLHISSPYIMDQNGDKDTLHRRLPPNLEVLRVDLNPPHRVIEDFGMLVYGHEQLLPFYWEWLLLFPTQKIFCFPRLREIKIVEERSIPNDKVIKWELPKSLAELSEKADINMDIWICRNLIKEPE